MSARTMRSRRRKIERRARREERGAATLMVLDRLFRYMRKAIKPFLKNPQFIKGDEWWLNPIVTDRDGNIIHRTP